MITEQEKIKEVEAKPKYQRVGQLLIRPLVLRKEQSAFDLAQLFYAQFSTLSFEDDLIDYMRTGFVVTRPHLFAMVKMIDLPEKENAQRPTPNAQRPTGKAWFVRCIVGNLLEAISCLPCMLPRIAFCRENQTDKMVVCDTERLIRVAMAFTKRGSSGAKEKG
jgi:hypothetical protein